MKSRVCVYRAEGSTCRSAEGTGSSACPYCEQPEKRNQDNEISEIWTMRDEPGLHCRCCDLGGGTQEDTLSFCTVRGDRRKTSRALGASGATDSCTPFGPQVPLLTHTTRHVTSSYLLRFCPPWQEYVAVSGSACVSWRRGWSYSRSPSSDLKGQRSRVTTQTNQSECGSPEALSLPRSRFSCRDSRDVEDEEALPSNPGLESPSCSPLAAPCSSSVAALAWWSSSGQGAGVAAIRKGLT